jgi:hypothetical protein
MTNGLAPFGRSAGNRSFRTPRWCEQLRSFPAARMRRLPRAKRAACDAREASGACRAGEGREACDV